MTLGPALRTLYADLLQQLQSTQEQPASIYIQRNGPGSFYYARRMAGAVRRDEYIGRADEAAALARVETIRAERRLAAQRRTIISALKRTGLPAPGRELAAILSAMADAGLLNAAVLVGTAAYQCYPALVGDLLPSAALMTQDADFATVELALAANDGRSTLLDILQRADASFRPVPGLSKSAPPASFRSTAGFRVDLVTPVLRRNDPDPMPLPRLAAGAVPLQYLGWLIAEPAQAAVLARSGILVQVPQPVRFAIHKLILAQRRPAPERLKRQKDLLQARSLIMALQASDPELLLDTLAEAKAKGSEGWRKPILRSLDELGITLG